MAKDQITRLDEQIGHLEDTVAKEFHKQGQRFDSIDAALNSLQSDVQQIKEAFKLQDDRMAAGFRDIGRQIDTLGSRLARRPRRS